ncbi:MAG: methylmalonyl-CoA mutase [Chloroflexi bacterium]|nr:methylmalonyl-CoA mutase [Chloroflexota bacterium]|tara:strand:- start:7332 stop:8978 length:1647 start_codon:yes stop_codon:yes gene_type:complete
MSEQELNRWKQNIYDPANAKFPERKSSFLSESEIPIEPLYSGEGLNERIGFPGEYPYTRGVQPSMYRGRFWTMRQYAGFSTPEDSNSRYRHLLSQGQTGLSVAFDLPTQTGYDADHNMAYGEIGKVGVPVSTLADMEILFDEIPLSDVTTSMTINATAPMLLALYLAVANKQGVPHEKVGGTTQNDILKEYIARGTYIFPPKQSMRLITDMFSYCAKEVPLWNTISISGYHMREAGATAPQELAFTLSNGMAYVQSAIDAGLNVDEFADRLSFFFVAHNNIFEEAAKFRAARRMWADIMKNHFKAKNPRSWVLRFHTQTAGVTLQAQQPEVNVVRTTLQALAAVLGGTQSLHVNSKDEALGLPTEESATLALRTQQVLANESGVTDTIDPLGGSYFVENLTNTIEQQSREYMEIIDKFGGAVAAIEKGFQKKAIEDSAYKHLKLVESGERVIVGVNAFSNDFDEQVKLQVIPKDAAERQINRLRQVREERDNSACEAALKRLQDSARSTTNVMPAILECVQAYTSLGEICDTLRNEFGTYRSEAANLL